MNPMN